MRLFRLGLILVLSSATLAAPSLAQAQVDGAKLFQQYCAKCHGATGTGSPAEGIPDFTLATWQAKRSDVQLRVSILEGKGTGMPAFRGKVSQEQARALTAHVRKFGPGQPKKAMDATEQSFDEEFRRLQAQLADLQRQFRELSVTTSTDERATLSPIPKEASRQAGPASPECGDRGAGSARSALE
jgi:mono/diheme cytochrome c family protein